MDEKKIRELAMEYGLKCDPLNQTPEKQADIRQGFIEGMNQALNLFSVSGSLPDSADIIEAEKIGIAKREKQGYVLTFKKKELYSIGFYDAVEWMSNNR